MSDSGQVTLRKTTAAVGGMMLCAAFFGLTETVPGLRINFFAPFTRSSAGEVYFWLGHALLLLPGTLLLGYALSHQLGSIFEQLSRNLEASDAKERRLGYAALFLIAIAFSRVARLVFLQDFPVTDDEYAAQFGGQILALGKVAVAAFNPLDALPDRFLYLRNGMLSSFDWPGIQMAWALAEWTHTGSWIFAVMAAVPVAVVAILIGERLGNVWGMIAAAFLLVSPMSFAISMSSHAHLLSRAMIALAFMFYLAPGKRFATLRFLAGLCAGFAFLSRPVEAGVLFFPPALCLALRIVRRQPRAARSMAWVLSGAIAPLALFALHNWLVTGVPWLPARFASNPLLSLEGWRGPSEVFHLDVFWNRFGANVSYNLFMLAVWFLGPLGIALTLAGVMTNPLTRVLGQSVACILALGLFHDNQGLHLVGPIHYSETVVPLTIIAVHGLQNLIRWCKTRNVDTRVVASALAASCALGLGTFDLWHSLALRRQSEIQAYIYGFIDSAGLRQAIILAPQFSEVWRNAGAEFRNIGTFVYEWRRPHPDWSDDVLILKERTNAAALKKEFPDRQVFQLRTLSSAPYLALTPMTETASKAP